jgi:hypothetical protein
VNSVNAFEQPCLRQLAKFPLFFPKQSFHGLFPDVVGRSEQFDCCLRRFPLVELRLIPSSTPAEKPVYVRVVRAATNRTIPNPLNHRIIESLLRRRFEVNGYPANVIESIEDKIQ